MIPHIPPSSPPLPPPPPPLSLSLSPSLPLSPLSPSLPLSLPLPPPVSPLTATHCLRGNFEANHNELENNDRQIPSHQAAATVGTKTRLKEREAQQRIQNRIGSSSPSQSREARGLTGNLSRSDYKKKEICAFLSSAMLPWKPVQQLLAFPSPAVAYRRSSFLSFAVCVSVLPGHSGPPHLL